MLWTANSLLWVVSGLWTRSALFWLGMFVVLSWAYKAALVKGVL